MFVQEDLTTTIHEVPNVSWELPEALEDKFFEYGAFAKIIFNKEKTAVINIEEDTEKKAALQADLIAEEEEHFQKFNAEILEMQGIKALAKSVFRIVSKSLTNDEVIQCRGLARNWMPDEYKLDDVCTMNGMPYRCCQTHSSTDNPDWNPENTPALWAAYHGTTIDTALPWKTPTGAHDIYKTAEMMIWKNDRVMMAIQNTNFSPDDAPSHWKEIKMI